MPRHAAIAYLQQKKICITVYAPESIALLVQADSSSIPPFCTLEFPPLDVFFVRQLSLWKKLVQTAAGWIRKKLDQDEERCELVEEDDGRVVCRCAFGTRMKCPVSFALQRLQPASLSLSDTFRLHRRNVERRRQRIVSLMLRNKLVAPGGFVTSVKLLGLMLWILVNVIKTSVLDTLKFVAFDWVRVMFRAFTRKQTDA